MDDEGQAPRRDKAAERAIYEAGQKQGDPYWQVRRPYETDAQVGRAHRDGAWREVRAGAAGGEAVSAHTPGPHIPEDCHVEQCSLCAPIFEARERAKTTLPSGAPLPWKVRHCDRDGAIVEDANGLAIATVWGRAAEHASKLAAAPDLLAALVDLVEQGPCLHSAHDAACGVCCARAASAKAVKP